MAKVKKAYYTQYHYTLTQLGDRPMYLSTREFWGVVHGMVLGALFLLAYGGGFGRAV